MEGLDKDVPVISTPCDVYRAARMIFQAAPVDRVCNTQDMVAFRLDDYIDDVREKMLESRFRCYPVLDEKGMVAGTVSRFHLIRPRRKKVVLVDHNERSQSVPGLDRPIFWRSSTITGWPTCRREGRYSSATSRWAPPPPSWPPCTRSGG